MARRRSVGRSVRRQHSLKNQSPPSVFVRIFLKFGTHIPWSSPNKSTKPLLRFCPWGKLAHSLKTPIPSLSFRLKLLKFGTHVP